MSACEENETYFFFLSSFFLRVLRLRRVLSSCSPRFVPTNPSFASISSPSSVTLLRIKGIAFFCSVFSRIPSLRSSLIELLHVSNLQDEPPSTSDSVDITAKEEVEEIDVTNGDGIDSIGLVSLIEALVN